MIKDGFVYCPVCEKKTKVKIIHKTKAMNFPLFCPKCKCVTEINISNEEVEVIGCMVPGEKGVV